MNNMLKIDVAPFEKLVVAVSSRALFNLDESHAIFENKGVDAYCQHQIEHESAPLEPGVAFGLVKKLLALNEHDPCQATCGSNPAVA